MTSFQTEVRRDFRTAEEIAADTPVAFTISIPRDVALQLAQFCRRAGFETCFDITEAEVEVEERMARAYKMLDGINAVEQALCKVGFYPR